ncbi:hypothetical protein PMAYCL1PPCAC_00011, partial [Pristionchus mayeri]
LPSLILSLLYFPISQGEISSPSPSHGPTTLPTQIPPPYPDNAEGCNNYFNGTCYDTDLDDCTHNGTCLDDDNSGTNSTSPTHGPTTLQTKIPTPEPEKPDWCKGNYFNGTCNDTDFDDCKQYYNGTCIDDDDDDDSGTDWWKIALPAAAGVAVVGGGAAITYNVVKKKSDKSRDDDTEKQSDDGNSEKSSRSSTTSTDSNETDDSSSEPEDSSADEDSEPDNEQDPAPDDWELDQRRYVHVDPSATSRTSVLGPIQKAFLLSKDLPHKAKSRLTVRVSLDRN